MLATTASMCESRYRTKLHYQCKTFDRYFRPTGELTMWHCMAQQQYLTPGRKMLWVLGKGKDDAATKCVNILLVKARQRTMTLFDLDILREFLIWAMCPYPIRFHRPMNEPIGSLASNRSLRLLFATRVKRAVWWIISLNFWLNFNNCIYIVQHPTLNQPVRLPQCSDPSPNYFQRQIGRRRSCLHLSV